ncbi:MAG: hypothetical protein AAF479_07730 [Pseudomonadota bacterium]
MSGSNLMPGPGYDDFYDNWVECDDCGGSGEDDSMCECEAFEDICCCLHPTPARCDTCRGKGGWPRDDSAEDQALHEAENDNR